MRERWQQLTGSLWFVPALIVAGAAVVAAVLVDASARIDAGTLERFPRLFGAGADSSRSMLATIAGSMITVAGVTFSITVVAVSQASAQYTPRILRNFMRDRPSQLVLGAFAGTFVYCLVVMRTVRSAEERLFVPSLAVLVAFLFAIAGIGFLVYFIHHIAGLLEAGSILARVSRETVRAVDRLFPDGVGEGADAAPAAPVAADWISVPAVATGYIQSVDGEGLLGVARAHDAVVRMERGIGEFVVEGATLASVAWGEGAPGGRHVAGVTADINGLFTVSEYRTVYQDAAFGIRQMVDIALKALSPGVNDSTTAVTCVDYIGAVLVRLAGRRIEPPHRTSADGRIRVIARGPTFDVLLDTAFDEIRRSAAGNVSVLARMLRVLGEVAAFTPAGACGAGRRLRLGEHAERIRRTAERCVPLADDRAELEGVYGRTRAVLEAPTRGTDSLVMAPATGPRT